MNPHDMNVLDAFAEKIRERFPDAEIRAFGSRVSGTATEESDLDVCVILDHLDDAADRIVLDAAWEVGFERDVLISTVTFSNAEFYDGPCRESAFVGTVLKDGLAA